MSRLALLQQQTTPLVFHTGAVLPISSPWQWWTPEDIAHATNTPVVAVLSDWPIIYTALESNGIGDYDTCRAVLATIAIETAHTFKPVVEAFWLDDAWRWANLRYAPYWGRGYVQLTWLDNYTYYGWRTGHPELVDFPEKALQPMIAAQVLSVYFVDRGIALDAHNHDWYECRRKVQGAYAGIDDFITVVDSLESLRLEHPLKLSEVLAAAYQRVGDPYVVDGDRPGGFDCSGLIAWAYESRVNSFTDDIFVQTSETLYPSPGDPVLYEYYDPSQPGVRFPHVGFWLNDHETLDARYGYGVGVHPHLLGAKQYVRRVSGVRISPLALAS